MRRYDEFVPFERHHLREFLLLRRQQRQDGTIQAVAMLRILDDEHITRKRQNITGLHLESDWSNRI